MVSKTRNTNTWLLYLMYTSSDFDMTLKPKCKGSFSQHGLCARSSLSYLTAGPWVL